MTYFNYQKKALSFAYYPEEYRLDYPSLGLCGESGEIADKLKKIIRDCKGVDLADHASWADSLKEPVLLEIGDVTWYLAVISKSIGSSLCRIMSREYNTKKENRNFSINRLSVELSFVCAEIAKDHMEIDNEGADIKALSIRIRLNIGIAMSNAILLSNKLGKNISEVMDMNIAKLTSRAKRNVLGGSGDYR